MKEESASIVQSGEVIGVSVNGYIGLVVRFFKKAAENNWSSYFVVNIKLIIHGNKCHSEVCTDFLPCYPIHLTP